MPKNRDICIVQRPSTSYQSIALHSDFTIVFQSVNTFTSFYIYVRACNRAGVPVREKSFGIS